MLGPTDIDVCDPDSGFGEDLLVESALPVLVRFWRGDITWAGAPASGKLVLRGPAALRRALPEAFRLSVFAGDRRPEPATVASPVGGECDPPGPAAR